MLLDGKRILVTGVLNDASIAFSVAELAQQQGAEVVLSSFGRAMSLTRRAARRLPSEPEIVELDVTDSEQLAGLADVIGGRLDGVLHGIAFAPESCLGGGFLTAPWEDVSVAMQVSVYSLQALTVATLPLIRGHGGSVVGLDFDNATQAWPVYDWMGVAKAALGATSALPRPGPRCGEGARQPRRRRTAADHRGEEHPRLRAVRGGLGRARAARLGRRATASRSRRPASRCSRTGSPPRPARSSTSTAASTPSAPDPGRSSSGDGPDRCDGAFDDPLHERTVAPAARVQLDAAFEVGVELLVELLDDVLVDDDEVDLVVERHRALR